jgi:hypothetical protein
VFDWAEGALPIVSTVREIIPRKRLVWDGPAHGTYAIHVWEFIPTDRGVLVRTQGRWEGEAKDSAAARRESVLEPAQLPWTRYNPG